ncbi:methyltransferase [Xanthobacteraceae bacterium Astr-EGSB]|uniref:protein-L-isoaspartate O-methyltransferase family protein n=1 Tax=Astrobacterium formosum TaxID=3069710 RepID=UPI0027B7E8A0|nr:methyltransferase [Xanthobacteraceae bacterium Astr-EGSB]
MPDRNALKTYFARMIAGKAGIDDARLIDAFASVERERFVGPGPWKVSCFAGGYVETPSDDLAFLYQDVVVALDPERRINNGEPHLHARCLAALGLRGGETAVHVGCGTGYYTAILAHLVGPAGRVHAYEIEADLARRAQDNLAPLRHVEVVAHSAAEGSLPACDAIYVNAGATRPLDIWLDALREGGRLLFPLTPRTGFGGMLLVTRSAAHSGFAARFVQPAAFIPCEGGRDDTEADALATAFGRGDWREVKSLRRHGAPDASCWFAGQGWWLSRDEPGDVAA